MEQRFTILNANGFSPSEREHRMIFAEANPEANPPPPPRAENLPDFNRLHQGAESNGNTAERTYNNVYDRMTKRQEAYRKEVSSLTDAITKAGGNLQTSTEGTRRNVSTLIEDLQNVYRREYTDSSGNRQEYRNGLYARVNQIEAAYGQIEGIIAGLEDAVAANSPGGVLPPPLTRYADRVRAERTRAALAGEGTGSVDVRTYTVPFTPESMSETSTYSLLRIPANFEFNFGANAEVARIMAGNYSIEGGMSNGIQYLRIKPAAATALARGNLTIPVTVRGIGNRVEGTTTATVRADGPINENPNVGNTLIRLEYAAMVRPDGTTVDGPGTGPGEEPVIPIETPEQVEKRLEATRDEYQKTFEANRENSENALKALQEIDREANPDAYLVALEAYVKLLGTENAHLNGEPLAWPDGDPRPASHANRRATLTEELPAREQEVKDIREYLAYADTLARLDGELSIALAAVPTDLPAGNDVQGWETRIAALEAVQGKLTALNEHLGDFYNGANAGATGAQQTAIDNRSQGMPDEIANNDKALAEAREGLDEAKRQEFHDKWLELNRDTTGASMAFGNADRENVSETISALRGYIDAIIAEKSHLELRGSVPASTDPSDDRAATWETRAGETIAAQTEMEGLMTQLVDLQAFQAIAEDYQTSSDTLKAVYDQPLPAENDVAGWQARIEAGNAWQAALVLEQGHLQGFEGSTGQPAATEAHQKAVTDRLADVDFNIPEAQALIAEAQEGKNEADRQVYDAEWRRLNAETTSTASWEDGDPEDMDSKISLLSAHVDALVAETSHLAVYGGVPDTKPGDTRPAEWAARFNELPAIQTDMQEKLRQFEATRDFLNNADTYEGETEASFGNIPEDPTDPTDQAGWEAKIAQTEDYIGRLTGEKAHLDTYAGSDAETGSTENQASGIRQRLADVDAALQGMQDTEMPRLQEERNKAECNKFEADWTDLKTNAEGAQLAYEATLTDGSDPTARLSALSTAISALRNENNFLGTLNAEIHDPADERLGTYYARVNTLNEDIPNLEITAEQLADLVVYEAEWEPKYNATETTSALPAVPTARGDVDGWTAYKTAVETYNALVLDEGLHMASFVTRPGFAVATPTETETVYNRFMYLTGEGMNNTTKLGDAERGLITATNDKFEDDWNPLNAASDGGKIPWEGVLVTDDMPADQKLSTLNVYRTALMAERGHLEGAVSLPAEMPPPATARPDYAARLKVVQDTITELDTKEGELNSLSAFEQEQTKLGGESENAQKRAEAALTPAAPEAANLPAWTNRRDAVQRYITALTNEQAHLQTLTTIPGNNVITANDRTDVETRLKDIETALKTQEGVLKTQQDGVDAARVDTVTKIDTEGPVRLANRTATATRTINRFQDITVTKGISVMTIPGNTNSANPDFPIFTREPGTDNVTIRAGERSTGTYEVNVAGKTMTITIPALPPRPRPR